MLKPKSPYNIESHFETYLGEKPQPQVYVNRNYRRAIQVGEKLVPIEVKLNEDVKNPELNVFIYSDLSKVKVKKTMEQTKWIFNTQLDLRPIYKFMEAKPSLKHLKKKHYGLRPERCPNFHEALIKAVIEQQISLQVAKEMTWQLIKKFGNRITEVDKEFWSFPKPEKLGQAEIEEIKDCKLSRRKAEYIKNISELVAEGEVKIRKEQTREEFIQRLMKIRGVGRWTAEMAIVRYFGTGRTNPAGDLGVRKAVSKFLGKDEVVSEQKVRNQTEEWGEHKGLIAYYLLADSQIEN